MTDHLPECDAFPDYNDGYGGCICPALRACEQRVREDGLYVSGVNVGYEFGLRRAREAVAKVPPYEYEMNPCAAIDAIDALRKGTK